DRQYQVKLELAGRTVKCKACGHSFTVPSIEAASEEDWVADLPGESLPLTKAPSTAPSRNTATVEGPSDTMMRLVSGGMVLAGIVLMGVNHAKAVMHDEVYIIALMLGPFALAFGVAGAISPNVVRAAGKYGKHLPSRYKWIAAAVGLVALSIGFLLMFVVYGVGR
ncbi:MAG: hypothetical protein JJ992_10295, partial [Planctomycetes bacterium]|nr:hypothetical protein [Planctomycetota bacterium]